MKKEKHVCDYPIRIPEGNRFSLAIHLEKVSWEGGCMLRMDWEPRAGDVASLHLVTPHGSIDVRNLSMDGSLLSFEDKGTIPAGTYDVDVRIVRANGERYGILLKGKLRIVQANDEAGLSGAYELGGAVVLYAKGEPGTPGAPGKDGTVAFEELSPEQIAMLKGDDGKSAYQLAVEDGYEGTEEEWLASLHGDDGDDGDDGKSAYEIYLDNVPEGETPMTEAQWLASLKGEKGDQGCAR